MHVLQIALSFRKLKYLQSQGINREIKKHGKNYNAPLNLTFN